MRLLAWALRLTEPHGVAGRTFGRLTVLGLAAPGKRAQAYWHVQCQCGTRKVLRADGVIGGQVISCGCFRRERARKAGTTHGQSQTKLYDVWCQMVARCTKPQSPSWHWYGARGIKVCERWRKSFVAFAADVGPRPSTHHSIDRVDNDGNYEPGNVRWATWAQQAANKRPRRPLTIQGETRSLTGWARAVGISESAMRWRLKKGYRDEQLLAPKRQCLSPDAGAILGTVGETWSCGEGDGY